MSERGYLGSYRYLRLPATGPFLERLAIAAVELMADHGIDEAFRRLAACRSEFASVFACRGSSYVVGWR